MLEKPIPRVDEINRPFWDGCNQHRLVLQQCEAHGCGRVIYFPRVCCPHCGGSDLAWRQVSGKGVLINHTWIHRVNHESFAAEAPYCFIAVKLAEGPTMFSRLYGEAKGEHLTGQAVTVEFVQHSVELKLPYFKLAQVR